MKTPTDCLRRDHFSVGRGLGDERRFRYNVLVSDVSSHRSKRSFLPSFLQLYLLDEPVAELDLTMIDQFYALVSRKREHGKTVVISSHTPTASKSPISSSSSDRDKSSPTAPPRRCSMQCHRSSEWLDARMLRRFGCMFVSAACSRVMQRGTNFSLTGLPLRQLRAVAIVSAPMTQHGRTYSTILLTSCPATDGPTNWQTVQTALVAEPQPRGLSRRSGFVVKY